MESGSQKGELSHPTTRGQLQTQLEKTYLCMSNRKKATTLFSSKRKEEFLLARNSLVNETITTWTMKNHCTLISQFPSMDSLFITAPPNSPFSSITVPVLCSPDLPRWLSGEKSTCNARDAGDSGLIPEVRKIPWRRKWQPTPVVLHWKSHGQRSLVGYSPWGHKELDTAEHSRTMIACPEFQFFSVPK